jgi:hypothetical protein
MARLTRTSLELKLMVEEFVELLREQKGDAGKKRVEQSGEVAEASVKAPASSEA